MQEHPRRKTPLNADTNESDTNFSYTGNDGRRHIMPNFIPAYDPGNGRKYSKSDRIKLANEHFAKRSPPTAQTQSGNQRNLRPLPLTGYQPTLKDMEISCAQNTFRNDSLVSKTYRTEDSSDNKIVQRKI